MTAALLIAAVGTTMLVGCESKRVATVAVTYSKSTTAMDTTPDMGKDGVMVPLLRWAGADQLMLTTWGSGSCPLLPTAVTLQNAHRINITLASHDGACTADLTPTNSVLMAPAGLDSTTPAVAQIQSNEVALPSR